MHTCIQLRDAVVFSSLSASPLLLQLNVIETPPTLLMCHAVPCCAALLPCCAAPLTDRLWVLVCPP
jgi:hypothetical protein